MSYYTYVDIQMSDFVEEEVLLKSVRTFLSDHYPESVEPILADFQAVIADGNGHFKGLFSDDFDDLMSTVSKSLPSVIFYVRGVGEEFDDVWLRKYQGGKIASAIGPFGDGEDEE